MVNKILKSLSLSYLSDHIGIQDFNLAKKTYEEICEDGHFENNITELEDNEYIGIKPSDLNHLKFSKIQAQ